MSHREVMRESTNASLERECSNWDRGQHFIMKVIVPVTFGLFLGNLFFNHFL